MTRRNWAVLAATAVVAAAGAASATGAPGGNVYGVCGKLTAKGKSYPLHTINVPCKTARAIMLKLANMPIPSTTKVFPGIGTAKVYPGRYDGMACAYLVAGRSGILCTSLTPYRQAVWGPKG